LAELWPEPHYERKYLYPKQELAALIAEATARGLTANELTEIQELGSDGYGVVSQLEQISVWLARHPAAA
jgi:hypothetical protein